MTCSVQERLDEPNSSSKNSSKYIPFKVRVDLLPLPARDTNIRTVGTVPGFVLHHDLPCARIMAGISMKHHVARQRL